MVRKTGVQSTQYIISRTAILRTYVLQIRSWNRYHVSIGIVIVLCCRRRWRDCVGTNQHIPNLAQIYIRSKRRNEILADMQVTHTPVLARKVTLYKDSKNLCMILSLSRWTEDNFQHVPVSHKLFLYIYHQATTPARREDITANLMEILNLSKGSCVSAIGTGQNKLGKKIGLVP